MPTRAAFVRLVGMAPDTRRNYRGGIRRVTTELVITPGCPVQLVRARYRQHEFPLAREELR
jgi:hypothetical protein